jgi:hypothetical protein
MHREYLTRQGHGGLLLPRLPPSTGLSESEESSTGHIVGRA